MNTNKILVIVDFQWDFIFGSLGGENQQNIVSNVIDLTKQAIKEDWLILATLDTHTLSGYDKSREGKHLNINHCILGTEGHKLIPEISELVKDYRKFIEVPKIDSFGLSDVDRLRRGINDTFNYIHLSNYDELEFHICGLVTNMCVLSTAVSLQNYFTRSEIYIHQDACASFDNDLHREALDIMAGLQMNII